MAVLRKGISTKTRFDVFKRDGFVCQYCGAHPPNAILHVDHIVSVKSGGPSVMDNYVTACDRCNLGKGAGDLSLVPMGLAEKAALIKEKEAQLRGYYKIMEAARCRIDEEVWLIVRVLDDQADKFDRQWFLSIKKFIERLGYYEVLDSAEVARAKKPCSLMPRFKYFCGTCWGKIRDLEGRDG